MTKQERFEKQGGLRGVFHQALPVIIGTLVVAGVLSFINGFVEVLGCDDILKRLYGDKILIALSLSFLLVGTILVFKARRHSVIYPNKLVHRFGRVPRVLCAVALSICALLGVYALVLYKPLRFRCREFYRERYIDADVFNIAYTVENSSSKPLFINSIYLFHRPAMEARLKKIGMYAMQVSKYNDRISLGVLTEAGQLLVPETTPITLPHNANARPRKSVEWIVPPAAHYDQKGASVPTIAHKGEY